MEDDTQLGHASSLQSGQRVPRGKRYHGSPAQETQADYCSIEAKHCSALRRWLYWGFPVVSAVALAPIPIMILNHIYPFFVRYTGGAEWSFEATSMALVTIAAVVSLLALFGLLVTGLLGVYIVPRLFHRLLKEDKTYVLYGLHYWAQGIVAGASNSRVYNLLFGDSSAIVYYLKLIGWNLNKIEQSGSNFGTNQKHDNPFLCDIGSGTMVSDGLSMINIEMSTTSFKISKVKIGDRNYLGNNIHYPAGGRTGANCLLGTKAMIPIDGPVRENVGLLGSPCFEIPRAVDRDKNFDPYMDNEIRQQRLRKKNVHNLVTVVAYLLSNWIFAFVMLLAVGAAVLSYPQLGILSLSAAGMLIAITAILYFAFCERASLGFKPLEPKVVSIYDPYFWFHERHWKFCESPLMSLFKGTPFKNTVSRLMGVRVGRKVFDDGCQYLEKTLIEIGDYTQPQ